jgi:hypothetical protein
MSPEDASANSNTSRDGTLDAAKKVWRERVTTVFPRQGHYASDTSILANYRAADITIERIADLMKYDLRALRRS